MDPEELVNASQFENFSPQEEPASLNITQAEFSQPPTSDVPASSNMPPEHTTPDDGLPNKRNASEPGASEEEEEEFEDSEEEEKEEDYDFLSEVDEEEVVRPVVAQQEAAKPQTPQEPAEAHQTVHDKVPGTTDSETSSPPAQGAEVVKEQDELEVEGPPEAGAEEVVPAAALLESALQEPVPPASGEQIQAAEGAQITDSDADALQPEDRSDSDTALDELVKMTSTELEKMAPDELKNLCNRAGVSPGQRDRLVEAKKQYDEADARVSNAKRARDVALQEKEDIDRKMEAPADQRNKAASNWNDAIDKVVQAGTRLGTSRDELTQALANFQTDLAKPAPIAPTSPLLPVEPPSSVELPRPAVEPSSSARPVAITDLPRNLFMPNEPRRTLSGTTLSTWAGRSASGPVRPLSGPLPPTGMGDISQTGARRFSRASTNSPTMAEVLDEAHTKHGIPIDAGEATRGIVQEKLQNNQLEDKSHSVGEMRMALQQMLFVSILTTCVAAYGNRQLEEADAAGRAFTGYVIALGVK